jgi:hypothetical protein
MSRLRSPRAAARRHARALRRGFVRWCPPTADAPRPPWANLGDHAASRGDHDPVFLCDPWAAALRSRDVAASADMRGPSAASTTTRSATAAALRGEARTPTATAATIPTAATTRSATTPAAPRGDMKTPAATAPLDDDALAARCAALLLPKIMPKRAPPAELALETLRREVLALGSTLRASLSDVTDLFKNYDAMIQKQLLDLGSTIRASTADRVTDLLKNYDAMIQKQLHDKVCALEAKLRRLQGPAPLSPSSKGGARRREATCDEFLEMAAAARRRLPHLQETPPPPRMLCDSPPWWRASPGDPHLTATGFSASRLVAPSSRAAPADLGQRH